MHSSKSKKKMYPHPQEVVKSFKIRYMQRKIQDQEAETEIKNYKKDIDAETTIQNRIRRNNLSE
jgi:hypothetical protein